jgi:hypothetical protein
LYRRTRYAICCSGQSSIAFLPVSEIRSCRTLIGMVAGADGVDHHCHEAIARHTGEHCGGAAMCHRGRLGYTKAP